VDVVIPCEERLERTPDGSVWGPSSYRVWSRYLAAFDGVRICARVRDVERPASVNSLASGPQVSVAPVPYYRGPWEYLRIHRQVTRAVAAAFHIGDAVIMRPGCYLAHPLYKQLRRLGAPYGVEVVGDPYEVFAPGVVSHPLRPLFRWRFTRQQQQYCAGAAAAAYVTERALQQRYPCGGRETGRSDALAATDSNGEAVLSTHYSSVSLEDRHFHTGGARRWSADGPLRLITVGTLDQLYKGVDVLLQAIAACAARGIDLRLTVVGGGRYQPALQASATSLGIGDRVEFTGSLPGPEAVKVRLAESDLFVLPSRTEGLPRALIEAMALGLPCIASAVGGIPELLPAEDLFPPGQPAGLASRLAELFQDPERLPRMSARNLVKAREFSEPVLRERRVRLYRHLRRRTEEWLQHGAGAAPLRGHRPRISPFTAG
jgi:glycosyltransferase involved in cell wall biosynthesis